MTQDNADAITPLIYLDCVSVCVDLQLVTVQYVCTAAAVSDSCELLYITVLCVKLATALAYVLISTALYRLSSGIRTLAQAA